jgi:hypothetical protein
MVAIARRVDETRFVNMNNKQSKEVWEVQSEDVKGSDGMKETQKWRGKNGAEGILCGRCVVRTKNVELVGTLFGSCVEKNFFLTVRT